MSTIKYDTPITVDQLRTLLEGVDGDLPVRIETSCDYSAVTDATATDIGWNIGNGESQPVFLLSMPWQCADGNWFGVRPEVAID